MQTKGSTLVFIYDVEQVPALERFLKESVQGGPAPIVVALDAEVDMRLREKNIPFLSARDYRSKGTEHFLLAEKWMSFLDQPKMSWFSYRDISFGQLFFPTLHGYLRQVIYYVDIIARVCDAQQELVGITVLASTQSIPQAGAYIVRRQISIIVDCVRLVGKQRGLDVIVYSDKSAAVREGSRLREYARKQWFVLQRALFGLGLSLLNLGTNLLRSRGSIRILASDYWSNIAPVLQHLSGVEVILCDRKEVFNVRLRNAWRYRMRFVGLDSYKARGRAALRDEALHTLKEEWGKAQSPVPDAMLVEGISLKPLFLDVLEEVVQEWLPATLEKIDELYALVDALHPDIVLLRATVSAQLHFPLLALIAKVRNIPSFELLHGMEYTGVGSNDKRHLAKYLGVYGIHTRRQLQNEGLETENLPVIGSPRFDLYELKQCARLREERAKNASHSAVIFCTAPDLFLGATFDTYDIKDYFFSVAQAARRIPGVSMIVKLRPGGYRETFYRQAIAETFDDIPHSVAQLEPLRELFPKADIAVSCQSTVTLEALQCGVPLVLFAATPVEALMLQYNFNDLAARDAVALCLDTEALTPTLSELARDEAARKKLSSAAGTFLDREFAFDGKGAERAAAFIRAVARKE